MVERRDKKPTHAYESERVEQGGESWVRSDVQDGLIERLLQIQALAGMDSAERRLQEFGEYIGRDGIRSEDQEWHDET